jgi:uncharacterized NAD(P)/FAD-binding protein YdhS
VTPRLRGDHADDRSRFARPIAHGRPATVAIIGAGASGTLAAVQLLRRGRARVILIDPAEPGPGLAYSTRECRHLLNVRAHAMSALADEPSDFISWCEERGLPIGPDSFLPRRLYGEYLKDLLVRFASGKLHVFSSRVENVEESPRGVQLTLSDASVITVDAAVLAIGNEPPAEPPMLEGFCREHTNLFVPDPWASGTSELAHKVGHIAIIGTGLTAVDVALSAAAANPAATISAVSRHGLLPRPHLASAQTPIALGLAPGCSLDSVTDAIAGEVQRDPSSWRAVVDGLRPHTAGLWSGLTLGDRKRFERELRFWWEPHRHRMAPTVAVEVKRLLLSGRLRVHAGGVRRVTARNRGGLRLELPAGGQIDADVLVNATGPRRGIADSANPLVRTLVAAGVLVPDGLGVGIATSEDGAVIGADGVRSRRVFTLGSPRRGERFESTAIPEIRVQAADLACLLDGGAESRRERDLADVLSFGA